MAKDKTKGDDGWPLAKDKALDFDEIVGPLLKAIKFCYKLQRRNAGKAIPWKGPEIGQGERACCLLVKDQLSAKGLAYNDDDQGRDALQVIVGLAIQLGIEQGRRIFRDSPEFKILQLDSLMAKLRNNEISTEQFEEKLSGGET